MTIISDTTTETIRETKFDGDLTRKEFFNETGETFMLEWYKDNLAVNGCTMKLEREFYQLRQLEKIQ